MKLNSANNVNFTGIRVSKQLNEGIELSTKIINSVNDRGRVSLISNKKINILNGPLGHPYTGRDIPNKGDLPKNGIIDKIKKLENILTDGKGIGTVVEEGAEKATDIAKGVGGVLKEGVSRFFEDIF